MKIQPVKRAPKPRYPTRAEAALNPEWMEAVPRRWKASPGLAALLGFGMLVPALEGDAQEDAGMAAVAMAAKAPAAKPAPGVAAKEESRAGGKSAPRAAGWVAPALAEAMEHDGRGGFGCVAINPPVYLSEAEAVEIIQAELEAAGLEIKLNVRLKNVWGPKSGSRPARRDGTEPDFREPVDEELTAKVKKASGDHRSSPKIVRTEGVFDLGDVKRRVFVEYLSMDDYDRWMGDNNSTASYCDFPALVPLVTEALEKSDTGQPVSFGVLFDPLAKRPDPFNAGGIRGLTPGQRRLAAEAGAAESGDSREMLRERGRNLLRAQTRHFVEQLRARGILAPRV